MILRKRQRLAMALLVIACLLFQQGAMAAYACTMAQVPTNAVDMSQDCTTMATPQPSTAVCAKYCSPDPKFANGQTIPVPPALALPPVVHDLVLFQASRTAAVSNVPLERFDLPPRLRYCRLLI